MSASVLFCLVLVSSVSALVDVGFKYHETIGIPTAKKIIAYEEEILRKQSPLERIIGGKLVYDIKPYPYFAGLQITLLNVGISTCGASLVLANKLLTAAHCWKDGHYKATSMVVVLGSYLILSGGTRITTKQVTVHPKWDPRTLYNDVAVITLPRNVEYTERIQPIALPDKDESSLRFEYAPAVAVGYGKTSDDQRGASTQASAVNLTVTTNELCQKTFGVKYVIESTICTSGEGFVGTCSGDSGGPLATYMKSRMILIGIKSFGLRNNCRSGKPTAFARVTSFLDFIHQHINS